MTKLEKLSAQGDSPPVHFPTIGAVTIYVSV